MTAIDATGLHALEMLAERLRRSGRALLLCGLHGISPRGFSSKPNSSGHVGSENILPHVETALHRARETNAGFGGVGQEMAHDFQRSSL